MWRITSDWVASAGWGSSLQAFFGRSTIVPSTVCARPGGARVALCRGQPPGGHVLHAFDGGGCAGRRGDVRAARVARGRLERRARGVPDEAKQ